MAEKSGYKKLVAEQAKILIENISTDFEDDADEHGGGSERPNLAKWLDRTNKLHAQLTELSKGWNRAQVEEINNSSRNSVAFGDPKESAQFALLKDILREIKRQRKQGA